MAFKIQSGLSKPKVSRVGVPGRRKYPFDVMEVGDAFFIPGRDKNTMSTHASSVGKQLGRKFSTLLVWVIGDDEEGYSTHTEDGVPVTASTPGAIRAIGVWRDPDPKPAAAPRAAATVDEDEDED